MTEIKSEIKEEPMFSFKNFLKPTSANVNIWGNAVKSACITLIAFSTTLIMSNPGSAIAMILAAVVIGGVAESLIFFTREKPKETLVQAVVDVIEEKKEGLNKIEEHVE